ncbi:uncharacterized protein LOC127520845 [Ctenopharyngodon idella]|uniref:uncharacterized protein LOC127520845 n=1 Tax=Ctenopharyngodon idella TaxID=7959 RepID=UPI002232C249|nr:uncharacterized protein LOC127520845 [Ctenopharyngodon idella]
MKKMFLRLVLFCLCLWCRAGVFGLNSVSVMEGDSVTLNTNLTERMDDDQIMWRFWTEDTLIAEINATADRISVYDDVLDGRFRDRLKLDKQTGSLTITNIRTEHGGIYVLQIHHKNILFILTVHDEVMSVKKGDSVTLHSDLTEMKDDDKIQWRFGVENTVIAEINKQDDSITVYNGVLGGRFRDRLKLDHQTGSLTITNITKKHAGDYVLMIWGAKRSLKAFRVSVYGGGLGDDGVKLLSVMEGDSVTLKSDLTEMKNVDVIQWSFWIEDPLIAEINKQANSITVYYVLNGRFRDRLKLDKQTGSLTITNTRTEHAGVYQLQTHYMSIIFILAVHDKVTYVKEGDSVTLNSGLTEIMDDYEIMWCSVYENVIIAEIDNQAKRFAVYDDVLDGRFRDRLKLDKQTGSLTITNTRMKHAEDYVVLIMRGYLSLKSFRVSVYDSVHCCGSTEAVIRLVFSALVGVATVILVVYDIRSRRAEQDQAHVPTSET